jgi:hypothetical protein
VRSTAPVDPAKHLAKHRYWALLRSSGLKLVSTLEKPIIILLSLFWDPNLRLQTKRGLSRFLALLGQTLFAGREGVRPQRARPHVADLGAGSRLYDKAVASANEDDRQSALVYLDVDGPKPKAGSGQDKVGGAELCHTDLALMHRMQT